MRTNEIPDTRRTIAAFGDVAISGHKLKSQTDRSCAAKRLNDIHSARSPASFMTLDHFAISVLRKAVHSSGELPIGT